jgi:amino acid adenylation domain-containing protein
LRASLVTHEKKKYFLFVDMHHIVSDGISVEIFQKEMVALYGEKDLPPVWLQYRDYCRWQERSGEKEEPEAGKSYWLEKFSGELPLLNLPLDYTRPAVRSFAGAVLTFTLNRKETQALKEAAGKEKATLYMMLMAVLNVLLAKLSGQEDIIVGTATAGRSHADLENIIGMFIDTLALRNYPRGEKTFSMFLRELRQTTLEAFENQEYQFEELIEELKFERDVSRNPLFDVMFVLQNMRAADMDGGKLKIGDYTYISTSAKFDLAFVVEEKGESLSLEVEYCTKLFKAKTIGRFISYFKKILSVVIADPGIDISGIDMLSAEEKQRILTEFNDSVPPYPVDKTIPLLFSEQAARTPDSIALTVWDFETRSENEIEPGPVLTYKQLNGQAHRLAAILIKKGVSPGKLVGIMAKSSLEMIVGIIGILKTGCGYVPLNPKAPVSRNLFMMEECGVKLMLTTHALEKEVETYENSQVETIFIDDIYNSVEVWGDVPGIEHTDLMNQTQSALPGDLAYVIFTSGSTGNPKGVPITHANLCPLLHWGYRDLGIGTDDRVIRNLAYYFDWSVWEIFITLTSGAGLYMAPAEILLNPEACVSFIETHRVTVLHVTPTQYQYLVHVGRKMTSLLYLFIGAEKLTYDLVKRSFDSVNETCRLFNMYGPTEATIISAVLEIYRHDYARFAALSSVPIGVPVANAKLLVLDNHKKLCPAGVTGELVIAGDGITRGYLNRPELAAEKFMEYKILNSEYRVGAGCAAPGIYQRIYRTGDLARWLPDGNIEFIGRIDYQVKIRGFRIELGEIENRLLSHQEVREAVVIDIDGKEAEKYLCAYIIFRDGDYGPGEGWEIELRDFLSQTLPDYMVPSYFIGIENIPLNSNGKVNRRELPLPDIVELAVEYRAPGNEIEEKIADIWARVLGKDKEKIGIDDSFFHLGGHSLKGMVVLSNLYKEFNVKISMAELFRNPSVRGLSKCIKESVLEKSFTVRVVEKKEYYSLTSAQKRFYILQKMEPGNTTYNMMMDAVVLQGKIDIEKMEYCVSRLIERHEALRTSFIISNNETVQYIQQPVENKFEIEYSEISSLKNIATHNAITDIIERFRRPFDLSRSPLLRLGLVKLSEEKHLFLFDMHHIISDGVSFGLTYGEFMKIYTGKQETLPALNLQYKDYSEWRKRLEASGEIKKQEEYWLKEFSGPVPQLAIPLDYERPEVQSFAGEKIKFSVPDAQAMKLRKYAVKENTTMFMVVLTLTCVFLSKLSGQDDIVMGTPTIGRKYAELYHIIGVFINTLALRNYPGENKSFAQFLKEVKERTIAAFDNQDYQFEDLVKEVWKSRDNSRNPIFDVLYSYTRIDKDETSGEEENFAKAPFTGMKGYGYRNRKSLLDLVVIVTDAEESGEILFVISYCTKLFKKETMKKFVSCFKEIISAVSENKDILLKDIKISYNLETAKPKTPQIEFEF